MVIISSRRWLKMFFEFELKTSVFVVQNSQFAVSIESLYMTGFNHKMWGLPGAALSASYTALPWCFDRFESMARTLAHVFSELKAFDSSPISLLFPRFRISPLHQQTSQHLLSSPSHEFLQFSPTSTAACRWCLGLPYWDWGAVLENPRRAGWL